MYCCPSPVAHRRPARPAFSRKCQPFTPPAGRLNLLAAAASPLDVVLSSAFPLTTLQTSAVPPASTAIRWSSQCRWAAELCRWEIAASPRYFCDRGHTLTRRERNTENTTIKKISPGGRSCWLRPLSATPLRCEAPIRPRTGNSKEYLRRWRRLNCQNTSPNSRGRIPLQNIRNLCPTQGTQTVSWGGVAGKTEKHQKELTSQ